MTVFTVVSRDKVVIGFGEQEGAKQDSTVEGIGNGLWRLEAGPGNGPAPCWP